MSRNIGHIFTFNGIKFTFKKIFITFENWPTLRQFQFFRFNIQPNLNQYSIVLGPVIYINKQQSPSVCLFVRSFVRLFISLFIRSFVCLFICSFICSLVCLFVCLFVRSFVRSFVCLFIRSFIHLFVHSFVCSFIPSFIRSLVHMSPFYHFQGVPKF